MVIKALKQLNEIGYNLKLTLCRSKRQRSFTSSKAIKDCNGETFVELLGHVEQSKLPNLLANSNLFIFASSCENMPNTLVESMCIGLPIKYVQMSVPCQKSLKMEEVFLDPESIRSIRRV